MSFQNLQKEWEEKLQQNGFVDAEKFVKNDRKLKQYSVDIFRPKKVNTDRAKSEYFAVMTNKIASELIDSEYDRDILVKWTNGVQQKIIAHQLGCHDCTIRNIVRKYESRWNVRHWNSKKLKLYGSTYRNTDLQKGGWEGYRKKFNRDSWIIELLHWDMPRKDIVHRLVGLGYKCSKFIIIHVGKTQGLINANASSR